MCWRNGSLTNGTVWMDLTAVGTYPGVADGMKIDTEANLYCSGPGGIQIFDKNGAYLGSIRTPEVAANFTWSDEDMKSLYITATSSLYRLRVKCPGPRLF
jgi:gluconolactonase